MTGLHSGRKADVAPYRKIIAVIVFALLSVCAPAAVFSEDGRTDPSRTIKRPSTDMPAGLWPGQKPEPAPDEAQYKPGVLIVKLRSLRANFAPARVNGIAVVGASAVDNLNKRFAVNAAERVFRGVKAPNARVRSAVSGREVSVPDLYPVLRLRLPADADVRAAAEAYRKLPEVAYAEPDYIQHILAVPDDPQFGSLWGLNNTGQTGGTPDADIDAPEAWAITTGSTQVLVAVVDTGIDHTHPDLSANIWQNPGEIPANGLDDDGNGYIDDVRGYDFAYDDAAPTDGYGHGTHVAGTIGAAGNNATAVAGVNWHVKIAAVKGLDDYGSGTESALAQCIIYAANIGARVINNSWGPGGSGGAPTALLKEAIDYAAASGALVVFAGGNSNSEETGAAGYAPVLGVAATDSRDKRAYFSQYGAWVDISAPGTSILSTVPNGLTATYSGTSMASPHVAGAAALVWSRYPQWSAAQVRSALENGADPIDQLNPGYEGKLGKGRLNVYHALLYGTDPAPPTGAPGTPVDGGLFVANRASFDWSAGTAADPESGIAGYEVAIETVPGSINFSLLTTTLTHVTVNLVHGHTYYARIRAVNGAGQRGEWSPPSDGVFSDQTPPVAAYVADGAGIDVDQSASPDLLNANWSVSDQDSGLAGVQYALGLTPGATDLAGWTSVGTSSFAARPDLGMAAGTTYYFSVQALNGSGLRQAYFESLFSSSSFAVSGGTATRSDEGISYINLPFAFPFYGVNYTTCTVSPNGLISFDGYYGGWMDMPRWGSYNKTLLAHRVIAPLWDDLVTSIHVSSGPNSILFRWNGVLYSDYVTPVNFSAELFRSGEIRFHYGAGNTGLQSAIGVFPGYGLYPESGYSGRGTLTNAASLSFFPVAHSDGIKYEPGSDTEPPSAITDLSAVPGAGPGELLLSWSAPGDDGNAGTAAAYELRYRAEGPIDSEAAWAAADIAASSPPPQPSGGYENETITGLAAGSTYYLAVRARDEAGNWAPLSSPVSGYARPLATPLIFEETFESGGLSAGGWSASDIYSYGTMAYWGVVSATFGGEGARSGDYKAYCAGTGYSGTASEPRYREWMDAFLSKRIDLPAYYPAATLSFSMKVPSLEYYRAGVAVFLDSTTILGEWQLTPLSDWTLMTVDLSPYIGTGSHTLSFRFFSDSGIPEEGAYIDDVRLWALPAPEIHEVPVTPMPSAAGRSTESVTWTWPDVVNETGYRIRRSTDGHDLSGALPADTTGWTYEGLTPNAAAGVTVEAFNTYGASLSGPATAYSLPAPPADTAVSAAGGGAVSLNWAGNSNPAGTIYQVWRSQNGNGFLLRSSVTALSYMDNDLAGNTTAWYKVRALSFDAQPGVFGAVVSTFLPADNAPPAAITGLAAGPATSYTDVMLSWPAPGDDGPAGNIFGGRFRIDFDSDASKAWGPEAAKIELSTSAAAGSAQSFLVTGLPQGATWYFRVWTADGELNWSPVSNGATFFLSGDVADTLPTFFSGVALSTTVIRWSWRDNAANETGYRVVTSSYGSLSADLPPNTTYWLETGLSPGLVYSRKVLAFNAVRISSSSVASAETPYVPDEDFESGDLSRYAWMRSGSALWAVTAGTSASGAYSVRSGTITHNQSSTLELSLFLISSGTVRFGRKVSSENNFDYLKFYVDGVLRASWSGEAAWGEVSFPVTSTGTHLFTWTYSKDSSVNYGNDAAWIDAIKFPDCTSLAPPASFAGAALSSAAIKWSWQDNSANETGYRIASSTGGPISPDLPPNTTYWIETGLSPGVVYSRKAVAFNAAGSLTSAAITMMTQYTADEDFETGDLSRYPWMLSGGAPWMVKAGTSASGAYSVRSGTITHSQSTSLTLSLILVSSGTISFYRKVSSELGWDYLKFYIDGALSGSWSGELAWAFMSYPVTSSGTHVFDWTYTKDSSVNYGSDAAWIDAIRFPAFAASSAELSPGTAPFAGVGASSITASWNSTFPAGTVYHAWISTGAFPNSFDGNRSSVTLNRFAVLSGLAPNTKQFCQLSTSPAGPYTYLGSTATLSYAPGLAAFLAVTSSAISLDWSPGGNPEPGTNYEVWLATSSAFLDPVKTPAAASFLQLGGLAARTTYYFKVRSLNLGGTGSGFNAAISTKTLPAPPGSIVFNGAAAGVSSITWAWDSAGDEVVYDLIDQAAGVVQGGIPGSASNWAELHLATNTAYTRKITAFNGSGGSSSTLITRYTLAAPPAGLELFASHSSSAVVRWSAAANPAWTSYEVKYWSAVGSTSTAIVSATSATLTGIEGQAAAHVQVRALNGDNIPTAFTTLVFSPGAMETVLSAEEKLITYQGAFGEITVRIPRNTFDETVQMTVSAPGAQDCPSPAGGLRALTPPLCVQIRLNKSLQPARSVDIGVVYQDASLGGADEARLVLAHYNSAHSVWVPLASDRDTSGNKVTAKTDHFSVFQIMEAAAVPDLSRVTIGPNILRTGREPGQLMTFRNLPAGSRVRIYTLVGELLCDTAEDGTGNAVWNGRNRSGNQAASGIYVVLIEGKGEKRTFRVAVQR